MYLPHTRKQIHTFTIEIYFKIQYKIISKEKEIRVSLKLLLFEFTCSLSYCIQDEIRNSKNITKR